MAVGFRDSSRMVTRSLQQHIAKGHRNDDRDVTLQQQLLCADDIPRTRIVNENYKKHLRRYVTTGMHCNIEVTYVASQNGFL